MTLPLAASIEAQWKGFNAKLRNQIRKSELSGLSIRVGGGTEVGTFYDVFARNMRDLGTPVYSRQLFESLLHTFPEACRVLTVRDDRHVVAGAIAVAHRDTLEVPWAASRRDALPRCPNHRLYWELIQHAIKAGFRQFDFGRSSPGSGPFKFKAQWGAKGSAAVLGVLDGDRRTSQLVAPKSTLQHGRSRLEAAAAQCGQLDTHLDRPQYSLKVRR